MSKISSNNRANNYSRDGKRFDLSTTKVEHINKKERNMEKILLLLLIPLFLIRSQFYYSLIRIQISAIQKQLDEGKLRSQLSSLTMQERRIADLAELSEKEIASKLNIEVGTVKKHKNKIYRKLNINKNTELVLIMKTKN